MKCTVDKDCEKTPVASYVWDWGEEGLTCAEHQVVISQKMGQLKRGCVITPLQPGAPEPITRDERIKAYATERALQEELAETQARGLELYRANESLKAQLRTETAKRAALEAEIQSSHSRIADLLEQVGEARLQAGKENAELQQLRAIVGSQVPPVVDAPQDVDPAPAG